MTPIVGASGFLGRAVAPRLLSAGHRVRLMERTPGKVEDLKRQGAEVVEGDSIDPASLAHFPLQMTAVDGFMRERVAQARQVT